jgi:elongation factor 3
VPGFLEGVKNKDKAIVKANNCHYTYPNTDRKIVSGGTIQLSLSSRVACLGPNGAGKSTFIKLLTGRGLHSPTSHLNTSRVGHTSPCPSV